MTTIATNDLPEIEWEQGQHLESIERSNIYEATGYSKDGRQWTGTLSICCGESEVTDIAEKKKLPYDDNIHGSWGGYDYH